MARIACTGAVCLLLLPLCSVRGAVFFPLGDLPGGEFHSEATRVSADGSTVVGWSMTDRGREAFRWTRHEGMSSLGLLPGGSQSTALGVSGDGSLIAGFADSSDAPGLQAEAFYWTRDEGMVPMGYLGDGTDSRARAISADGTTIVGGGVRSDGSTEAFRWTRNEGLVGLGDLPGGRFGSVAQNVSRDGNVIVGYGGAEQGREAFWWTPEEGMIGLGDVQGGDHNSAAWDITYDRDFSVPGSPLVPSGAIGQITNDQGSIAARFSRNGQIFDAGGELWSDESPVGRLHSAAYGSVGNSYPMFIVGTIATEAGPQAFIENNSGYPGYDFQPLQQFARRHAGVSIPDWHLSTAVSASDSNPQRYFSKNGVFVGTGVDPTGATQAWLLDLSKFEHEPIDGAYGWMSGPRGIFESTATGLRHAVAEGGVAPIESELLSPEFEIPFGQLADVSFVTSWTGSGGQMNVDVVAADEPSISIQSVVSFLLPDVPGFPQSRPAVGTIDPSRVDPNKKYRLRIRYFDSNESSLSLGPVRLDDFSMQGVTFVLPGDTNGDAKVDLADLNNVRNNFGLSGEGVAGDTNDDQIVDLVDLNNVRNNFGTAIGGISNVVPEPSALGLGAVALACGLVLRVASRRCRNSGH